MHHAFGNRLVGQPICLWIWKFSTDHAVYILDHLWPSKLPKHYHVAHWVHAYVLVCLQALCGEYMLGLLLIFISKSWGCPPLGLGMPFLDSNTCAEGGGVFIFARVFFLVWCHPWMNDKTDGWMDGRVTWKSFTKSKHDILYYIWFALATFPPFQNNMAYALEHILEHTSLPTIEVQEKLTNSNEMSYIDEKRIWTLL